jgi:hypothetical protein
MSNPHPKPGPGRPTKAASREITRRKLLDASPYAADYLIAVTKGEVTAQRERLDACKYQINQVIGCPATTTSISEPVTVVIEYAKDKAKSE